MNILSVNPINAIMDSIIVNTQLLTYATNITVIGGKTGVADFIMTKGDVLYLARLVDGDILILDYYEMFTGLEVTRISVNRLNSDNILLRYDDGADVHYRTFTIFGEDLIITFEDSFVYNGLDTYADELRELEFVDGLLYKISTKHLVTTLDADMLARIGTSVQSAELFYVNEYPFLYIRLLYRNTVFDLTNNYMHSLDPGAVLINGENKLYILKEELNAIYDNNTN